MDQIEDQIDFPDDNQTHLNFEFGHYNKDSDDEASLENEFSPDVFSIEFSPTKPGKPIAFDIGNTYLSLRWTHPHSQHVSHYEIQHKNIKEGIWQQSHVTENNHPYYRFDGLVENTEYEFKVRARYSDDVGVFSDESDVVSTKLTSPLQKMLSPDAISNKSSRTNPGQPKASNISSDSLLLSWDKPENKKVTYYEIRYKSAEDRTWCRPVFTVDETPNFNITGLQEQTGYEFKVRAQYSDEESEFSDKSDVVITKKMMKAQPLSSENEASSYVSRTKPGQPQASDIGIDSLVLIWDKPERTDVTVYEIKYKKTNEKTWCRPICTKDDKTVQEITGLVQDTSYEFKVRAFFLDVEGEYSDKSNIVSTKQLSQMRSQPLTHSSTKPGKPQGRNIGSDCLLLSWEKPGDAQVEYYTIRYKASKDQTWSRPIFTDDDQTFFTITGLVEETEFTFKVKPHYDDYDGEFSVESDLIKTLPLRFVSKPGKPFAVDVGISHIAVAWDKPSNISVEFYEIKWKQLLEKTWRKQSVFTDDNKPYVLIEKLSPCTKYEFKVRGYSKDEEGDYSDNSEPIMTKQSPLLEFQSTELAQNEAIPKDSRRPEKPLVSVVGRNCIRIQWNSPKDKNVTHYDLKYKLAHETSWYKNPKYTDDAKTFLEVNELPTNVQYQFKVRPHYGDKKGTYSEVSDPTVTHGMVIATGKSSWTSEMYKQSRPVMTNVADLGRLGAFLHPEATGQVLSQRNALFPPGYPLSSNVQYTMPEGLSPFYIQHYSREREYASTTKPGKPFPSSVESDCIILFWLQPRADGAEYYEIKMKEGKDERWSKTSFNTNDENPCHQIKGLLPNTQYVFKVKAHFKEGEGELSEASDPIITKKSPALSTLEKSFKLQDGNPAIYKLPVRENRGARNEKFKTRKCEFGHPHMSLQEKTIMIVGATGSGKSTLIDGFVNHLLGVKWEDDFRFKIIDIMSEEEERQGIQTESQTDWITSYRIHPIGHTCEFILNIIDTPGFGDTRGIQRDNEVVEQIRHFFTTKDATGIQTLEAVCFVTQAPLMRLTAVQKYIFDAILSIFGKDMADNVVAMVTFADGKEPPVLNALSEAGVPVCHTSVFNNSALFEPNKKDATNQFAKMFWEMGYKSFDRFLTNLPRLKTRSLQLTSQVLSKREQLQVTVEGLMPQIDEGLFNLNTMREERRLVAKYEREIRENKNFTYETTEYHQLIHQLDPNVYVTNCIFCNRTCHKKCRYANDEDKIKCSAMTDGYCTICPGKCKWDQHKNNDFWIEMKPIQVKKTYQEMKSKYELAENKFVSKKTLVQSMKAKFVKVKDKVMNALQKVRECGNFLRENAIRSDPLTEIEYIDLMMKSEMDEKRPGFRERLDMLQMLRRNADLKAKSLSIEDIDAILKHLGFDDE